MQQCGNCLKVYDESEYARCPYCYGFYEDYYMGDKEDDDYDRNENRGKKARGGERSFFKDILG